MSSFKSNWQRNAPCSRYACTVLKASVRGTQQPVRSSLPEPALEGPLLILSPHLDDAALSCSALIERGPAADVLTIFDGEPDPPRAGGWDRKTGFTDSASSMTVRRREDRAAFAGTPHRLAGLGLLDLQYAGHDRASSDGERIEIAVREWVEANRGGTVAAPIGAGRRRGRLRTWLEDRFGEHGATLQHPDRVLVRDIAVQTAAGSPAVDLLLYEEVPYGTNAGTKPEVAASAASAGRFFVPIEVEIDRESKARRISAYRSQMDHLFIGGNRLDEAAALPKVERYWHSTAVVAPSG